jgi:type II secretory pathway pseudopilin PulG
VLSRFRRVRQGQSETGSLVLSMGVLMILTFLSLALLARTLGSVASVRRTQDFSAALAVADSGLSDALFEIDQGPTATFSKTFTVNNQTVEYTATYVDQNTWSVVSTGTVAGVRHAIRASVTREVAFPFAIFTAQDMTFNGNGGGNITSYNSETGVDDTHHAVIGSNHAITVNGGGGGDEQHYFTPTGSCSGCANGHQMQGPRALPAPVVPATTQACPPGGVFLGIVNGSSGLPYLCDTVDASFVGVVKVLNPPLVVYVTNNRAVSIADASINTVTASGLGSPKGKDFRLYKAGNGAFDVGNGSHAGALLGVVYAPDSDITVNGGKLFIDGSLTVNQLKVNGNPNFTMRYDDTIATITTGSWSVGDWREVPSSGT